MVENESLRTIVVEDEAIVAMEIRDRLERLGWEVCGVVSSGEEAIELAGRCRPILILMDITLRGKLSGIEAAIRIYNTLGIPSLFLTASVDERILHSLESAPHFKILSKPFDEKEFASVVAKMAKIP